MLARTSSHWNKNVACAVRVQTTGTKFRFHEIFRISIIALRSDYSVDSEVRPFDLLIKPNEPDLINTTINAKKKEALRSALSHGVSQEDVIDFFEDWVENHLKLGYNTSGYNKNKILPLGHDYYLSYPFLRDLLTPSWYDDYFDVHIKDVQILANIINDVYAQHGLPVPYRKTDLTYIASTLFMNNYIMGDAMQEAQVITKCYQYMVKELTKAFRF